MQQLPGGWNKQTAMFDDLANTQSGSTRCHSMEEAKALLLNILSKGIIGSRLHGTSLRTLSVVLPCYVIRERKAEFFGRTPKDSQRPRRESRPMDSPASARLILRNPMPVPRAIISCASL